MTVLLIIIGILLAISLPIFALPLTFSWRRDREGVSEWRFSFGVGYIYEKGVRILGFKVGGKGKTKSKDKVETDVKSEKIPTEEDKGVSEKEEPKKQTEKKKPKKKEKKDNKFDFREIIELWAHRQLAKDVIIAILRFLKSLFRGLRINRSELVLWLALEDPYILGSVCALAHSIGHIIPKKLDFHFIPDFASFINYADFWGEFSLRTRVYKVLVSILVLTWFLPKRELYRFYKKQKKAKKKKTIT